MTVHGNDHGNDETVTTDWFKSLPGDDCGVSSCFMPCGDAACKALGCVRVYNARTASSGRSASEGEAAE